MEQKNVSGDINEIVFPEPPEPKINVDNLTLVYEPVGFGYASKEPMDLKEEVNLMLREIIEESENIINIDSGEI
jgi:hypothetical protein